MQNKRDQTADTNPETNLNNFVNKLTYYYLFLIEGESVCTVSRAASGSGCYESWEVVSVTAASLLKVEVFSLHKFVVTVTNDNRTVAGR
jgi:hypothetical protein